MKTTTFKAFDAANLVWTELGYVDLRSRVERNGTRDYDVSAGDAIMRLAVDDREIEIDDATGSAVIMAIDTDEQGQAYCDLGRYACVFSITRPLREEDLDK